MSNITVKPCEHCKESFSYEPCILNGKEIFKKRFCNSCVDNLIKADAARMQMELSAQFTRDWLNTCPQSFRDTDEARLARIDLLKWEYNPNGLLLVGPTGATKTRTLWKIAEHIYLDRHIRFEFHSEIELANRIVATSTSSNYPVFIRHMCLVDCLFIDDIGKAKYTDKVREALFYIVDERTSHGKPILASTQFTGQELIEKFASDGTSDETIKQRLYETGEAWVRRLREFCTPITLERKK